MNRTFRVVRARPGNDSRRCDTRPVPRPGSPFRRLTPLVLAAALVAAAAVVTGAGPAGAADAPPSSLRAGQSLAVVNSGTPPGALTELLSPSGRFDLTVGYVDNSAGVTLYLDLDQIERVAYPLVWRVQINDSHGGNQTVLTMQTDGNLVLYARPGVAVWSSHTAGTGSGNHLDVQDDGNLVVRTREGRAVWSTGTHAVALFQGSTLGPGQYLRSSLEPGERPTTVSMQRDGNLVVYEGPVAVWASNTSVPGASVSMQADGNLVIRAGGRALWASGTAGISGGPDDGAAFLEAYHGVRADARIDLTPGRHGGGYTYPWDTEDQPGEVGLLAGVPSRLILTSPSGYGVPGSVLRANQYLMSSNGYRLTMQTDGNLVERSPAGAAAWATSTGGHAGATFVVQPDGNLVVRGADGRALWNAGATNSGYDTLTMNVTIGTDGNVVARAHGGGVSWSTGPARG